jgi:trk system potassium uptake protein TrkH
MINWKYIFHLLGILLVVEAGFMLIAILVSALSGDMEFSALLLAALLTGSLGVFCGPLHPPEQHWGTDGYILVSLVWICYAFFGAMPYFIGGYVQSFTDAWFESMSGLTTCGASILNDIESLPRGILFWRAFTTGIGGMGILVMVIAIMPGYGTGNMMLYRAESSEGSRLSPRIKDTAKWIILLYLGLIFFCFLLYLAGGMSIFDAVCHAFPTIATAGFPIKMPVLLHTLLSSSRSMLCIALGSISFVSYESPCSADNSRKYGR